MNNTKPNKNTIIRVYCTEDERAKFRKICTHKLKRPMGAVIRKALNEYLDDEIFSVLLVLL